MENIKELTLKNYDWGCDPVHIEESVEYKGMDEKELTTITLNHIVFINAKKDINVSFKNINFEAGDDLIYFAAVLDRSGIFTIGSDEETEEKCKINVTFDNCTFYGYQNPILSVLAFGFNSNVVMHNCKMSAVKYGIQQFGDASASFDNCIFDAIMDTFYIVKGNSTFHINKCKVRVDEGAFLDNEEGGSGSIENTKFISSFEKPSILDVDKFEQENEDYAHLFHYNCIMSGSEGKISVVKCDIKNFFIGIFVAGKDNITLIDSKIKNCYVGLWANVESEFRIVNSTVEDCYKNNLMATENSSIDVYDSFFTKCTNSSIDLYDNVKASFHNCRISENGRIGLLVHSNSETKLFECTLHKNKEGAIYTGEEGELNVSKSSFCDNNLYSGFFVGKSEVYLDSCMILVTKEEKEELERFHIVSGETAKITCDKCNFSANNKEVSAFFSTKESDIYAKECTFQNLKQLATLKHTSKIYVKDSTLKDMGDPIARNEKDAKLEMVGCGGKLLD